MGLIIVVDPNNASRSSLIHQLSFITKDSILQFSDLESARRHLLPEKPAFTGTVFLTFTESDETIINFMHHLRKVHPEAAVILISASISLDEMRSLVHLGVDQILLHPFNVNQVKEKLLSATTFRRQVLNENLAKPSTTHFETRVGEIAPKYYRAALSGWLGENCVLPNVQPASADATLFVDCDQLKGINSVGVRSWVLWLKALSQNGFIRFEFENLRPPILQQASFIQGFIPDTGTVNSFYLYYWSDEIGDEKDFKVSRGKEFVNEQMKLPKFREEELNGSKIKYEIDPGILKFLKFYKGRIELV